jgi:hypothetical protein
MVYLARLQKINAISPLMPAAQDKPRLVQPPERPPKEALGALQGQVATPLARH